MQNSISHWQRMLLQETEEKELSPKQQKIAKLDPPADKIDAGDFKKLRGGAKIEEKVDMDELEFELKRLKQENPGKKVTYTFKQDSPKGYVFFIDKKLVKEGEDSTWPEEVLSYHRDMKFVKQKISSDRATYQIVDLENDNKPMGTYTFGSIKSLEDFANNYIKPQGGRQSSQFESEDHEVSMANNSIESIIKNAMDLKAKLGNDEKDIPAWIQDHITNAANFISQAAENYHEYGDHEAEETEVLPTTIMETEFISLEDFSKKLQQYKNGDIIKSQLISSYNRLESKDQEKAKELAKGQDVLPNPKKISEMSLQKIMEKINKNGRK